MLSFTSDPAAVQKMRERFAEHPGSMIRLGPQPAGDPFERLEKLAELHARGVLLDEA